MSHDRSQFEPDETGVSSLLATMKDVNAPSNFDFGVKAKIAGGRPARSLGGFRWIAAAAAPALIVAIVAGVWLSRPTGPSPVVETAAATSSPIPPPAQNGVIGGDPNSVKQTVASVANDVVAPEVIRRSSGPSVEVPESSQPMSEDSAVGSGKKVLPRGFPDPSIKVKVPRDFREPAALSVKEILQGIGADVNADLTLSAVRDNSLASKFGLKAGDSIRAINGKPVDGKTTFKGQFTGTSITVLRDGRSVNVDLKQ